MRCGILTHMVHALQHGTISLFLDSLNYIVFMNQHLEHVKVYTSDDWMLERKVGSDERNKKAQRTLSLSLLMDIISEG